VQTADARTRAAESAAEAAQQQAAAATTKAAAAEAASAAAQASQTAAEHAVTAAQGRQAAAEQAAAAAAQVAAAAEARMAAMADADAAERARFETAAVEKLLEAKTVENRELRRRIDAVSRDLAEVTGGNSASGGSIDALKLRRQCDELKVRLVEGRVLPLLTKTRTRKRTGGSPRRRKNLRGRSGICSSGSAPVRGLDARAVCDPSKLIFAPQRQRLRPTGRAGNTWPSHLDTRPCQ
jgi:hypothetical protein